jgi:hypothetical protein
MNSCCIAACSEAAVACGNSCVAAGEVAETNQTRDEPVDRVVRGARHDRDGNANSYPRDRTSLAALESALLQRDSVQLDVDIVAIEQTNGRGP